MRIPGLLFLSCFSIVLVSCNRPPQGTQQPAPQPAGTPQQSAEAQTANQAPGAATGQPAAQPGVAPSSAAPAPAAKASAHGKDATTSTPRNESARPSSASPADPARADAGAPPVHMAEPPAPPPPPQFATLPSGARLDVVLVDALDSSVNKSGDSFQTTLRSDLEAGGHVVVPKGSTIFGRLSHVKDAGRVEGLAEMSLVLTEIRVGDYRYPIMTDTISLKGDSSKKTDALKIGAGAGIGAIIGAITGGGKGAAIGAAAGGGGGTALVLATKGKALKLEPEQRFHFTLRQDLQMPVR
jgi:hypothetical protein